MLPHQKEDAEALRIAIMRGFATVSDAAAWADRVIVTDPRPDWAILDVCLAGRRSPAEMVTLLRQVRGEADAVRVMRSLLAHLLRALDADEARAERIADVLVSLTSADELPHEHFGWESYAIDDAFALARTGVYGTREQAVADLRRYLEQHASEEPSILEDVHIAEEQIARGEGVEHEEAKRRVLERLRRAAERLSRGLRRRAIP